MNAILEVGIGILFVYLLFSLLVSAVNEAIFGHLTRLRARVLEDSLQALLSANAKGFSVFSWLRRWLQIGRRRPESTPASQAPKFSNLVLCHPLVQALKARSHWTPSYIPAEAFVDAVLGTLITNPLRKHSSEPPVHETSVAALSTGISSLSDDYARTVLHSILIGVRSLEEARQRLHTWFHNAMERVTGAYKRYTQFWLYVWATAVVVWLNVDTIEITKHLVADATLRSDIAGLGVNFVAQRAETIHATAAQANREAAILPSPGTNTTDVRGHPPVADLSPAQLLRELDALKLPLGWGPCTNVAFTTSWIGWAITRLPILENTSQPVLADASTQLFSSTLLAPRISFPLTAEAWRLKLLGLVLTIAAVSQGAPFWFDLLNRVTNLRASGRPPPRTEAVML